MVVLKKKKRERNLKEANVRFFQPLYCNALTILSSLYTLNKYCAHVTDDKTEHRDY